MKMADLMCVELTVTIPCAKCKEAVHVHGPRQVVRCGACDADTAVRWKELLVVRTPPVDVFKTLAPVADGTVERGTAVTATRGWPVCACGRRFEGVKLAGAFAASRPDIACPACKKLITIATPPLSFRADAPSVVAVVGADIVPDGPPKPHLPRPPAGKTSRTWAAMFDRSLAR